MREFAIIIASILLFTGCSSCMPKAEVEPSPKTVVDEKPVVEEKSEAAPVQDEANDKGAVKDGETKLEEAVKDEDKDVKDKAVVTDKVMMLDEGGVTGDFHYPQFGHSAIDTAIENYAKQSMKDASASLKGMAANEANLPNEERTPFTAKLLYEVIRNQPDGADVMFEHIEYTGGAHDAMALSTMMLDKDGNQVDPWSLFENVDEELPKISAEARRQLREKLSEDNLEAIESMIEGGTEPKRENFKHIVRTDTGVRIYFDPYSVAPWAAGIQYIDYEIKK